MVLTSHAASSFRSERAERWILQRQEADGLWGGIQPPVVYSIIALHLQGYRLDHPVLKAALAGLDSFIIEDSRGRRLEACQSPVWDSALAVIGLVDAGSDPEDPAILSAVRWLLGKEITVTGDWVVRRPELAPGGWAFEFANDSYPDIDDTAEVVLALRKAAGGLDVSDACTRAVRWTVGMQSSDGGWGAFDADNVSSLVSATALLRLRRGHRSPLGRCDRTRRGDVGPRARVDPSRHRTRDPMAVGPPGARRFLVRTVGREPHLRDWRRRARPRSRGR